MQISAQEYFARGFEQYTMEGSPLRWSWRKIFNLFRKWLTKIYTALKGVPDVELLRRGAPGYGPSGGQRGGY